MRIMHALAQGETDLTTEAGPGGYQVQLHPAQVPPNTLLPSKIWPRMSSLQAAAEPTARRP